MSAEEYVEWSYGFQKARAERAEADFAEAARQGSKYRADLLAAEARLAEAEGVHRAQVARSRELFTDLCAARDRLAEAERLLREVLGRGVVDTYDEVMTFLGSGSKP